MRRTVPLVRSLLVLALVGCVACVDDEELPGTYVMSPVEEADTLWLAEGGRYRRVFAMKTGERSEASGRLYVDGTGPRWALALEAPDSLSSGARMPPLPPRIKPFRSWRPGARVVQLPVDETSRVVYRRVDR